MVSGLCFFGFARTHACWGLTLKVLGDDFHELAARVRVLLCLLAFLLLLLLALHPALRGVFIAPPLPHGTPEGGTLEEGKSRCIAWLCNRAGRLAANGRTRSVPMSVVVSADAHETHGQHKQREPRILHRL